MENERKNYVMKLMMMVHDLLEFEAVAEKQETMKQEEEEE